MRNIRPTACKNTVLNFYKYEFEFSCQNSHWKSMKLAPRFAWKFLAFRLFFWSLSLLFCKSSFCLFCLSFLGLFLRVWHWFDYTTSSETQSYEDTSALQISYVIFTRNDIWGGKSKVWVFRSTEKSEKYCNTIWKKAKFLFCNSFTTDRSLGPPPTPLCLCFFHFFVLAKSNTKLTILPQQQQKLR